ncbi:MAG: hypothetical protein NVS4B7_00700 [Ktedonobacteraceae bacterium]
MALRKEDVDYDDTQIENPKKRSLITLEREKRTRHLVQVVIGKSDEDLYDEPTPKEQL